MSLAELVGTASFALLFGLLGLVVWSTAQQLAEGVRKRAERAESRR